MFAPSAAGGLASVDASGGAVDVLTTLPEAGDVKSHRWPGVLPGSEALLLTVWNGTRFDIEALSLDSGVRAPLILLFETPYVEGEAAYPNFDLRYHRDRAELRCWQGQSDVTSDGRFILIQSGLESIATRLVVVLNWFEELERLAPAK